MKSVLISQRALVQNLTIFAVGSVGMALSQTGASAAPPKMELFQSLGVTSIPRPERLPPGSFLKEPAKDINELQLQLLKREEVSNRYAKTINMTPRMIRMAFSRLHLTTLPNDQALDVYYCHPTPKGEVIGHKKRRFRAGTKIFALADGTAALIQTCGNPTKQLKTLASIISRDPSKFATGHPADPDLIPDWDPTEPVLARTNPDIALDVRDAVATNDFEEIPNSLLNIPEEPNLAITRLAPYSEQTLGEWVRGIPRGSFNFLGPGLGIAGGLAGIGAAISGSKTSPDVVLPAAPPPSGGTTPPGGGIITPGGGAVPEPGAIGLLSSIFVVSFGFLWLKSRRKVTN